MWGFLTDTGLTANIMTPAFNTLYATDIVNMCFLVLFDLFCLI